MALWMLPTELIFQILFNLTYIDVINYGRSHRRGLNICRSYDFWNIKAVNDYSTNLSITAIMSGSKNHEPIRLYYEGLCNYSKFAFVGNDPYYARRAYKLGYRDHNKFNEYLVVACFCGNLDMVIFLCEEVGADDFNAAIKASLLMRREKVLDYLTIKHLHLISGLDIELRMQGLKMFATERDNVWLNYLELLYNKIRRERALSI